MLKAIVDDVSGVPEALRSYYEPIEGDDAGDLAGKFRLKVEDAHGFALDNTDSLKQQLSAERANRRKTEARAKEYDGLDPVAAREALTRLEQFTSATGDFDIHDKIAEIKATAETQRQALKERSGKREAVLVGAIGRATVDHAVRAALALAGGNIAILTRVVSDQVRAVEKDGSFSVEVVDGNGESRLSTSGNPLSVEELVAEIKASPDFSVAFSGGTSKTGTASHGPVKPGSTLTQSEWRHRMASATEPERRKLVADYAAGHIAVAG